MYVKPPCRRCKKRMIRKCVESILVYLKSFPCVNHYGVQNGGGLGQVWTGTCFDMRSDVFEVKELIWNRSGNVFRKLTNIHVDLCRNAHDLDYNKKNKLLAANYPHPDKKICCLTYLHCICFLQIFISYLYCTSALHISIAYLNCLYW